MQTMAKKFPCHLFWKLLLLLSFVPRSYTQSGAANNPRREYVSVGVTLNMESWLGNVVLSTINMSVSDFYAHNGHIYETRILLHLRDSKGDTLQALSAAYDLLENSKVEAIVFIPESLAQAELLAKLCDSYKVPLMSIATTPSSSFSNPHYIQIATERKSMAEGIAAIMTFFEWRKVFFISEDSDCGREMLSALLTTFQETNIQITYTLSVSSTATDYVINKELKKLMDVGTKVFVIHVSSTFASRLFLNAKRLRMMSKEYAWVLTDEALNLMDTLNSSVFETLQGAIGLRSHIPLSNKLQNLTRRLTKELWSKFPDVELVKTNIFGLRAYDTIWALAEAVERKGVQAANDKSHAQNGSSLLDEILQSNLSGVSGPFKFVNGRLNTTQFELVNMDIGAVRRVGFWTETNGISRELNHPSSGEKDLQVIIWPGGSVTPPKEITNKSKLRVAVPVYQFGGLISVQYDQNTKSTSIGGFCIDVFSAAMKMLGIDYEFSLYFDQNGANTGTYNDLTYKVYLGEIDAAVGDITITANRSLYVDFTSAFTDIGIGRLEHQIYAKSNMWIFLKPLHTNLWLTTGCFFIITGLVVWVIESPVNSEFQGSLPQQLATALWFSLSTLVYAHRERLMSNLSRFVIIVWIFVVLILTTNYTATLTSMLTVQQIELVSKGKNYAIGYPAGSLVEGIIFNNLNFTATKAYNTPEEYATALSDGTLTAIIDEVPYLKFFLAKYPFGNYVMVSSEPLTSGFGFAFPKGSPLVSQLSRAIAQLREEGELSRIEHKWLNPHSSFAIFNQKDNSTTTTPNSLKLESFKGLFLITGVSSTLSLIIFLVKSLRQEWRAKFWEIKMSILRNLDVWRAA